MDSENSISVDFGIINSVVTIFLVSGESVSVMGNIETSISSSFKGSEDSVTDGGIGKTNIKNSFKWSSFSSILISREEFSINCGLSRVHFFKRSLFKESSGTKKSGGISCRVIG